MFNLEEIGFIMNSYGRKCTKNILNLQNLCMYSLVLAETVCKYFIKAISGLVFLEIVQMAM